ncbi:cytidylate kinase-like family protein [bacterium]|nr:cytidylate kinase-like family protein [bacterium]
MTKLADSIPMEKIVSRQIKLWERTSQKKKRGRLDEVRPCITISKEIGSQGVEIGQRLSEQLEWRFFDKNLVDHIANDAKRMKEVVEIFDEKTRSEIHSLILGFLDRNALSSDRYFKHLVTVMLTIAEYGHGIILGRGGNFILPTEKTLKVRIIASIDRRVENLAKKAGTTTVEARETIQRVDRERAAFVRRFFRKDAESPHHYDLVLNVTDLSLPAVEGILLHVLNAKFPAAEIRELSQ